MEKTETAFKEGQTPGFLAIDQSPMCAVLLEPTTLSILAASQGFNTAKENLAPSFLQNVHIYDHGMLRTQLKSISQHVNTTHSWEMRIAGCIDGLWRWVLVTATTLSAAKQSNEQSVLLHMIEIDKQKPHEPADAQQLHRWNYALVSSGLGVWDHDFRTENYFYSQTWHTMRGLPLTKSRPYASTEEWLVSIHPDDREFVENAVKNQKLGKRGFMNFEYRERHADGHWIWIECRGDAVAYFPDGRPARIVGTDRDITGRKESEALLEHTRKRLELALKTSKIGVFEYNRSSGKVVADARISEIYGFDEQPTNFKIQRALDTIKSDDLSRILQRTGSLKLNSPAISDEFRLFRENDGAMRQIRHFVTLQKNIDGEEYIVGINWDVTEDTRLRQDLVTAKQLAEARNYELDRAKSDIERAALHDYLTELPNRRFLDEELSRRVDIAQTTRIALMQLDIDDFKAVNDTYGHGAGDAVLKHTANILLTASKHNDFVARVGGDEFVLVTSYEASNDNLMQFAKRLLLELSKPIKINDQHCRIGACIGIVTTEEAKGRTSRAMLKNSDLALKHAKQQGRDRIEFYTPDISDKVSANRTPADKLMQAIDRNEFVPFYQPQYDATTGELFGIETLARWKHKDGSFGAPASFIPLAESLNVMNIIDTSVLHQVLHDHLHLESLGLKLPRISLNLSPRRLSDPALIPSLQELDLPDGKLSFELLESIFLDRQDDISTYNLKEIRRLGIDIDIDDFGTGYTSILGLLKVAPNGLKIARELVAPLNRSREQRAIVKSIIDIGKTLNLRVIAEGVETEQHAQILTEIGCDILQGYWLARPMSASALEVLLQKKLLKTVI